MIIYCNISDEAFFDKITGETGICKRLLTPFSPMPRRGTLRVPGKETIMFNRITAAIRRFFARPRRGAGILPVNHGQDGHAPTNTILQVDDLVVAPQSDHLQFGPENNDPLTVTLTPLEANGNGQTG